MLGLPDSGIVVTTSGRIHWAKGWPFLLEAFKCFLLTHSNGYLCFVGDGEDRPALEKRIRSLDLVDRVRVTGLLQPLDVAAYLNASDMFVLGSIEEGWSTVLVEALACGKPMVSTDVSSAREVISEGKNGFVVDRRDPQGFAAAMRKAFMLKGVEEFSVKAAERYALRNLARDLGDIWSPLASVDES
jgi:glycosyltransferase involved in cell wall biosynthesis